MTRRKRRFLLSCLIAATTLANLFNSSLTVADDIDIDSIVAEEHEAELCGWGTHDSAPPVAEAVTDQPEAATEPANHLDASLATMAAAACASTKISVEQLIEPFAMVGPHLSDSLAKIREFQQWCLSAAKTQSKTLEQQPLTTAAEVPSVTVDEQGVDERAVDERAVDEADVEQPDVDVAEQNEPLWISHVPIIDFEGPDLCCVPWAIRRYHFSEPNHRSVPALVENAEVSSGVEVSATVSSDDAQTDDTDSLATSDEIADIALADPIDVIEANAAAFGPSILELAAEDELATAQTSDDRSTDLDAVVNSDSRSASTVGGSPMIFSMKEAYSPYDLAVRDLYENGVLSIAKRPFCIRARMELPEHDLALEDIVPAAADEDQSESLVVDADPEHFIWGSPDCLLEDWVWRATSALEEVEYAGKWTRPQTAGRQIAALVLKQNRAAARWVDRLAKVWPPSDQPATAGAMLLARAGASECQRQVASEQVASEQVASEQVASEQVASEQVASEQADQPEAIAADGDQSQLAEAAATLKQWVSAAATLRSRWLPRLAEVTPSPENAGKTSRR